MLFTSPKIDEKILADNTAFILRKHPLGRNVSVKHITSIFWQGNRSEMIITIWRNRNPSLGARRLYDFFNWVVVVQLDT